jgi:hypothetical protein
MYILKQICIALSIIVMSISVQSEKIDSYGYNGQRTKRDLMNGSFEIIPVTAGNNNNDLIGGRKNLLLNCKYKCTPKPSYPLCKKNDDKDITDGKVSSRQWRDPAMIGMNKGIISIDLSKETDIDTVALRLTHSAKDMGVSFPDKIAILSSNDHESFMIGGYFLPQVRKSLVSENYAIFRFNNLNLKGRYLIIMFSPSIMIDEIQAAAPKLGQKNIQNKQIISKKQLDPIPFYPKNELYVSDIAMPFYFKKGLVGNVKITLPQEVRIIEPPKWDNCKIVNVKKHNDKIIYDLKGVVSNLYIKTSAKIEKEKKLGSVIISWRGQQQFLNIYQIRIPRVTAPKGLIMTNGFASYESWSRWKSFPLPYIRCGMNYLDNSFIDIQFLHTQPRWPAPKGSRIKFYKNLSEKYGIKMIVGASFPENNIVSKLAKNSDIRKFVDYRGKTKNNSICPLEYLKHGAVEAHKKIIDAIGNFGDSGLVFIDYEPNWYNYGKSRGCCCETCRAKFKEYFSNIYKNKEYIDPIKMFTNTNKYAFNNQAWIDWKTKTVTLGLFGNLHKKLNKISKENVKFGYYAVSPVKVNNTRFPYANYDKLYKNGWAGIEMPYYYKMFANSLWEKFREDKRIQKKNDIIIPWLSAGNGKDYGELPSEQVRYMVLESMAAGFDGICWFSVRGFDARDWQQLAIAINEFAPAAPLIKGSKLLSPSKVKAKNALVRGISNNGDTYIIVADYRIEESVKVNVELKEKQKAIVIDCSSKKLVQSTFSNGKIAFSTMLDADNQAKTFLIIRKKNIYKYLTPRLFICPQTIDKKIWWSPGALKTESYTVKIGHSRNLRNARKFTTKKTQLNLSSIPVGKYYWQVTQKTKEFDSKFSSEVKSIHIK